MKKFAFLIAAAACLVVGSASVQPASAQSLSIGIGDSSPRGRVVVRDNGYRSYDNGYRSYARERVVIASPRQCRTVTVRSHRANGTIVIRKYRRCR